MRTLSASAFKAKCLRVMDEVRDRRDNVLITKKGVPVARLVPVDTTGGSVFGCLRDRFEIIGDVVGPATAPETWEAAG